MEFESKQIALRAMLAEQNLDAMLLRRVSSFAWATCGAASYVNTAATEGVGSLLITPAGRYLVTDNIEAPRFEKEEQLKVQGWDFQVHLWHEQPDVIARLTGKLKLGADVPYPGAMNLSSQVARLRARLTPEEGQRYRQVGRLCSEAMEAAIQGVKPGQNEQEIAAILGGETQKRGVQPIVVLIATDERVFNFRHPLPTDKQLEHYAMLVLCGRKAGLVISMTRLVHFGELPEELKRKAEAVSFVDAAFIAGTRPGRTTGDVLQDGIDAYGRAGFPNEWNLHHQGGAAGYEAREYFATPGSADPISEGQVYAWNPSIAGTKSEDTILVGAEGNELLTAIPGWPTTTVSVRGQTLARPRILEIT